MRTDLTVCWLVASTKVTHVWYTLDCATVLHGLLVVHVCVCV